MLLYTYFLYLHIIHPPLGVFSLLFLFNYLWLLNANIIDFDCVYVQRSVNWPRHTVLVNKFFTESKQNHSSEVRLRWTIVNPGTEKSTLSYLTYNVEIKPWTTGHNVHPITIDLEPSKNIIHICYNKRNIIIFFVGFWFLIQEMMYSKTSQN